MEDKCANKAAVCMLCEHERLAYHEFPCDNCNHNGGTEDMFYPKPCPKAIIPVSIIKDSGERRIFETGAVRDITEDKGRCDLIPLDVVNDMLMTGIMQHLDEFQQTGDYGHLLRALFLFGQTRFGGTETMLLEVSKHFANGAKKYEENNWRKGIPVKSYIDSAVRHYLKFSRSDEDEPHDLAFVWNLLCAIWTCKHKPELNEYVKTEEENDD